MNELTFSEEQLDYLREMMNIGTGNAATALSRLLHQAVDTQTPEIRICRLAEIPAVLGRPIAQVTGIKMELTGDAEGYLFFIVPESSRRRFIELVQGRMTGKAAGRELTVMTEVADIVTGSHLKAIRDFCGLDIRYSDPSVAVDMFQALLDEAIARMVSHAPRVILIQSIFVLVGEYIDTFLVMILEPESVPRMVDSIEQARKKLGSAQR